MIKSVSNRPITELLNSDGDTIYEVPRYQREYTWSRDEWENLFNDIQENDEGYFLGSMICINRGSILSTPQPLELVDGQQRAATLSLLLAAIYSILNEHKESLSFEEQLELLNLKRKLVLKKDADQTRVVLQVQNNNLRDYKAVLSEAGVLKSYDVPPYAGNRKIFKAYRYFQDRINHLSDRPEDNIKSIMDLREKINNSTMVLIEVESHSDAYTLFESLNNRGVPLTAVDLIKNKLLSRLEVLDPKHIDVHFESWNLLIKYLGDDYTIQERFFRQYYNSFKNKIKNEIETFSGIPVATRSNLMRIYETLIERDTKDFLDKILEAGRCYSFILNNIEDERHPSLSKPLVDLERIQGAPSYLLLLYLLMERNRLNLDDRHLSQIIQFLVKFFVRRNLTDIPPTRDLTRLFMHIVEGINDQTSENVVKKITRELIEESSDEETFRKRLEGPVYSENSDAIRFILCAIAEKEMNRERWTDLWATDKKQYYWTIEHIFPQGQKIPQSWVDMIASGDHETAADIRAHHVDRLGNLTITGFNSTLSNKSFIEKRDRTDKKGSYVGYKNGLYLNKDLAECTEWTVDSIEKRTELLVKEALDLFKLEVKV